MSLHAQRSAVVVGAGVGGLATTVALRSAGWHVVVHERAAQLQAAGTGLVLWPNAVRALAALGLDEELRARATVLRRSGLRRPDGRWLSRLDVTDLGGTTPVLGVLRPDLVDLLARAVGPEDLRLGSPVTEVTAVDADLVVGADGARSTVRQAFWPEQPPARYRGYTAWRAVVPAGLDSDGATETWGRGERFGVVPVGRGQTYLYATANTSEGQRAGDELAELRRRFGRWQEPIPALLDALEPGAVLRHDVHAVEPALSELHRGRVALVGDAAHAMEPNLGQGACLALEDAVVLAAALREGVDVAAGLTAYSAARVERVASLARRSRQIGVLGQTENRVVVRARDALVRLTPASAARRASQRTVAWFPPATARPGSGTT